MDGLKVGPSSTQFFRAHANTMEEAIQIALHPQNGSYSYATMRQQAQCKELKRLEPAEGRFPCNWSSIHCYGCEKLGHMQRALPAGGQKKFPSKPRGSRGPWQKPRTNRQRNWSQILIDSGASTNFTRRQMVERNGDKYADALRESEGRGQVSVRLADGTVVNVPGVRMDLAVKFEDFDSTESFLVLDMDKYDLVLGMPWLEKHDPWIDWHGKVIGASRTAVSERALVSNVSTSARDGAPAMVAKALSRPKKSISCLGRRFWSSCEGGRRPSALPEASALLNVEDVSMKKFLAELKAGDIAEMAFLTI
ncbi:LOW QUALITY PROTEIN: Hypothetical protein PHPALM_14702 [Phytophthora palmivora]|uniref:Gag protein n=1 Tax=Phytophthora palmivora TaxID=4796 RepID=A0A2P4XU17_9STRA|nr:LOW QUALITY PROTEIN: Hypothetical protein PHPALM_14702 [Phytophthora palmivora]